MKLKLNTNTILISIVFFFAYVVIFKLISFSMPGERTTIDFYCVITILSIASAFMADIAFCNDKDFGGKAFLLLSMGILFFVFAFRNANSLDDTAYMTYFYRARNLGILKGAKASASEPAYFLVLYLVGLFTDDYLYVQIVTAAIPMLILVAAIYTNRHRQSCAISIFLFIIFFYFVMLSTNLSRMFFSYAIMIYGFRYIEERNCKKYILCLLSAFLFHYSSMVLGLVVYLTLQKPDMKKKGRYAWITYFAFPVLMNIFMVLIVPYTRFVNYSTIMIESTSVVSRITRLPLSILLLWGVSIIRKEGIESETEINNIILFEYIFGFSTVIKLCGLTSGMARLVYYFDAAFVIAFPMVVKKIKNPVYKIAMVFIILTYGLLYLYMVSLSGQWNRSLYPYQNVFFSVK